MKPFKSRTSFKAHLKILYGGLHPDRLAKIAWLFAYAALWNNQVYSVKEKQNAVSCIKLWLESKNPRQRLTQFIQRILIARQNIKFFNLEDLALPSSFFDPDNAGGFNRTNEWWLDVRLIRESSPLYKLNLRDMAEAILAFSACPSPGVFRYWKSYFSMKDDPILLNLFQLYCANFHYHKA